MDERSREFVESSVGLLKAIGETQILEYPGNQNQRSIDVAIRVAEKGSVIAKVAPDVTDVGKTERDELKRISAAIGVNAFIVAETRHGQELIEGVIYDVEGVKVINVNTIVNVIYGGEYPVIFEDKDGFKIKLDGNLLRALRLRKGYSLGVAAERLHVSRKTIYDYEREVVRPTIEIAERIIEEFGEEVAKPIDIFNPDDDILVARVSNIEGHPVDSGFERIVVERLRILGWKFTHARRAPLDIAASKGSSRVFLTIPHPHENSRPIVERTENMIKLAKALSGSSYVVVTREQKTEAERLVGGPDNVLTVEELKELLGGQLDFKGSSDNRETRYR
ncbi:MAG: helix-turn-helix domain-containing protein [Acidilobus sp.]